MVLQREPDSSEISAAEQFVQAAEESRLQSGTTHLSGWEQLAQVLLASNEFMFID
jgi:hypothetical protein